MSAETDIERLRARVHVLEDRIGYAIDLIRNGHPGVAMMELDRALSDPDMNLAPHASDCALHNGPAYEPGTCDCRQESAR